MVVVVDLESGTVMVVCEEVWRRWRMAVRMKIREAMVIGFFLFSVTIR